MTRKILTVLLLIALPGCASYTQSKIDLTAQAEAGVALVRKSVEAERVNESAARDSLRTKLDAAFDTDVASRESLDADWVIAHRKAYSLAVDAYDADRRAADDSAVATLRTIDAIDAVLAQLQQMHADELKLTIPEMKR